MSNEENHGHQRKRLRAACKAATQRRGLNAGHVVCVVDTLQQHGLLEECVSKKQLRNDLQKHRVNWSAETTFALTLPLENGENFTWHVATPHSILTTFCIFSAQHGIFVQALFAGQTTANDFVPRRVYAR